MRLAQDLGPNSPSGRFGMQLVVATKKCDIHFHQKTAPRSRPMFSTIGFHTRLAMLAFCPHFQPISPRTLSPVFVRL